MTTLALRDYQTEALAALTEAWQSGQQRVGVSLPTGAGKTVIFAHLAKLWADHGHRVLILVHRDELAGQTVDKLRATDDRLSVGRVQASHNDTDAQVIVGSVQTLRRDKRRAQIGRFALIVCDEAHRSASDEWLTVLTDLGAFDSDGPRVAGFTATWTRADKRGLGDIWETVAYSRDITYMIERGYLVRPIAKAVAAVDLEGTKVTAGDYSTDELGVRMATEVMRESIVTGYLQFAADRKGVLFAPTIASADYFADGLNAAGIRTEGVYASTSLPERAAIYDRLRRGTTQVLASCTALAEGWDEPQISACVLARPTLHAGLFVQQIGRVLRPWPGKRDALVLDAAGATARHDLEAIIDLGTTPPPQERDEDEPLEDEAPIEREAKPKYAGPVEFRDIDLFAGTGVRWLVTTGGVIFVSAGQSLVFLMPHDGAWSVGQCSSRSLYGGRWLRVGMTSEQALAWGSQYALDLDSSLVGAKSRWRKAGRPSEAQVTYARGLGLTLDPTMNRGDVSDAIAVAQASRTLRTIGDGN